MNQKIRPWEDICAENNRFDTVFMHTTMRKEIEALREKIARLEDEVTTIRRKNLQYLKATEQARAHFADIITSVGVLQEDFYLFEDIGTTLVLPTADEAERVVR